VKDFTDRHSGYHINPEYVNGSAVEMKFEQLKYISSGQLIVTSYVTSKATLLTRQCVQGTRKKDDYRNTELYN